MAIGNQKFIDGFNIGCAELGVNPDGLVKAARDVSITDAATGAGALIGGARGALSTIPFGAGVGGLVGLLKGVDQFGTVDPETREKRKAMNVLKRILFNGLAGGGIGALAGGGVGALTGAAIGNAAGTGLQRASTAAAR